MGSRRSGLTAIVMAGAVLWAIPSSSGAELRDVGDALRQVGSNVGNAVDTTVAKTDQALRDARSKTGAAVDEAATRSSKRATATDPKTQPPLHGTNPHGQGGVSIVDVNPSSERPLSADPSGRESGEDAIVGRSRGEQNADGSFRGRITILSLLGNEISSVETAPGETKNGPLEPVQTGVLDPLCQSSGGQACLSVLKADSTTTATGSANDFAVARADVMGLGVGAAESQGVISQDANCQTAVGTSRTANVTSSSGAVATAANSSSTSKSCRGQAPQVMNTSEVIGLGGTPVAIPLVTPDAGCQNGTPDTVTGLGPLVPVVCNADDVSGAAAVREALDVFVLEIGGVPIIEGQTPTSLAKETTAASESFTVAPAAVEVGPQCSDGKDNDGDGKVDTGDPGCHSDNDPNNPASFNPNDNDETDAAAPSPPAPEPVDDNDSEGNDDAGGDDDAGGGGGDGGAGGQGTDAGSLPFTGTDVVGLSLAGLLMLAGGLLLRRREGLHAL
ncbi:MAG: LPXTG cell wall anchor domain-containing protein [Solirubrobacteraceae bacterium]